MDNFRRRFSTLKGRLSFSESDPSPPARMKHRLQRRGTRSTNTGDSTFSKASVAPESLSQAHVSMNSSRSKPNALAKSFSMDFSDMPDHDEIEHLLEDVLEEMAIPKANQQKLRDQDDKKKWAIIKAHREYNPARRNTQQLNPNGQNMGKKSPEYWVSLISQRDSLGRPSLTVKDALELQSVFRTSHREFILDFMEMEGVTQMNRLIDCYTGLDSRTKHEVEILSHLVESYRLLMNNEVGMEGVLLIPGSIKSIAMAMDYLTGNDSLTEKVILLLSVACWWSEMGRQQVMQAIKYVRIRRRELSRFQTIVFLFEYTTDIPFKASIATFVTTVCNTPPTIEGRVKVRNDFFALDIIKVFDRVLARAHLSNNNAADEEAWNNIQTQYEVFVTMMRQDQKEIVHKMIRAADEDDSHFDLSNLAESWKIIQKNAHKADCQDHLLNVIQALFLIPTENTLAVPIYNSIIKYIFEATSIEKLGQDEEKQLTDPPELNFEALGKLFKKKMLYDAKVNQFFEKEMLVKRQQRIIKMLQKRLIDVMQGKVPLAEAANLTNIMMEVNNVGSGTAKGNGKGTGSGSGNGTGGVGSGSGGGNGQGTGSGSGSGTGKGDGNGVGGGNGIGLGLGGGGGGIDLALLSGLGLTETANEIEIMKEREQKLKDEIENLEKQIAQMRKGKPEDLADPNKPAKGGANDIIKNYKGKLDSTGLVPAGIAPGRTKKDAPPVPGPGMPGSLENAPIRVERQGSKKEVNQKGGLEALFAGKAATMKPKKKDNSQKDKEALIKLGLPDKKPIKPGVKMTKMFWNVISPENLEGTIWPELSDQNVKFDSSELEQLFGMKQNTSMDTLKKTKKSDGTMKPEYVKLIANDRRQNVGIALKRMKLKNKAIKEAIVKMDEAILTPQAVQVLLDTVPTADELTLIEKYVKDGSDPTKLAHEEKYLYEMSTVPRLASRLACVKTKHSFAYDARRILNVMQLVKAAVKEVNTSKSLRDILEIVLAIGNYLNGGTARGAAWGYKLDILAQLITIKDSINNGTLMHYMFVLFERNYPHLLTFSLPHCGKAVSISIKDLAGEMNSLAKSVQLIRNEIKNKSTLKGDEFNKVMSTFEVRASKDVSRLQNELEKVRTDFHTLAIKFAESGDGVEPKTFFPKLVDFEQGLKRAGYQIEDMRRDAERRKNMEDKKMERQTYLKLKKLVEATRDKEGNLDLGLIHAFKKAQSGKTSQVVDRFLEKYRREQERQRRSAKRSPKGQKFLDG